MSWREELRAEDFSEPYGQIARELGVEAALVLERMFRSTTVYFPTLEAACSDKIRRLMLEEYDGYNVQALALKYHYSERWVREIVREKEEERRRRPAPGQLEF